MTLKINGQWVSFLVSFSALLTLTAMVACGGDKDAPGSAGASGDLLSQIQAKHKLVAGVKFDSKPFGFIDTDGKVKGYDVDLIREITKRLLGSADAVDFEQVLSSTRVMAINSGNLDVVAATMTITPEREELIDFTDPYYVAGQAILVPKLSAAKTAEDLKDKRIMFIIGSTSEGNIKQRLPKAKLVGFTTATDALAAMKAGRGDAFTTDDTILLGFMQGNCDFRLLPDRLSKEPYGMGIRQDENHATDTFRLKINAILKEMEKDGALEKIKKKWITTSASNAHCPG